MNPKGVMNTLSQVRCCIVIISCPWSLLHPHELRGQFLKFRSILSYKGIVRASSRNSLTKSSFIKKYGHRSRVSLHFEPMV